MFGNTSGQFSLRSFRFHFCSEDSQIDFLFRKARIDVHLNSSFKRRSLCRTQWRSQRFTNTLTSSHLPQAPGFLPQNTSLLLLSPSAPADSKETWTKSMSRVVTEEAMSPKSFMFGCERELVGMLWLFKVKVSQFLSLLTRILALSLRQIQLTWVQKD